MSWSDNFPVYLDNLSAVYTASVLIAVFALFVAHYYQNHSDDEPENKRQKRRNSDSVDEQENEIVKGEFGGAFGKIKAAKQEALLKSLQTDETGEQRIEEKKAEEEQLKAIWELLSQQEEKFKVGSKEELEEQLRLYRRR